MKSTKTKTRRIWSGLAFVAKATSTKEAKLRQTGLPDGIGRFDRIF